MYEIKQLKIAGASAKGRNGGSFNIPDSSSWFIPRRGRETNVFVLHGSLRPTTVNFRCQTSRNPKPRRLDTRVVVALSVYGSARMR